MIVIVNRELMIVGLELPLECFCKNDAAPNDR